MFLRRYILYNNHVPYVGIIFQAINGFLLYLRLGSSGIAILNELPSSNVWHSKLVSVNDNGQDAQGSTCKFLWHEQG